MEAEATGIVGQGITQVIWAGMGGSVQTIYALKRMGYLDQPNLHIHPLDSTDPASVNRILDQIGAPGGKNLGEVLKHTMMIGVSMGMTSEEPITHLAWFDALLHEHNVPDPGSHIQVMTLPNSYLDNFARPRGSRMVPIQLDAENHTPGRMSAPATPRLHPAGGPAARRTGREGRREERLAARAIAVRALTHAQQRGAGGAGAV